MVNGKPYMAYMDPMGIALPGFTDILVNLPGTGGILILSQYWGYKPSRVFLS